MKPAAEAMGLWLVAVLCEEPLLKIRGIAGCSVCCKGAGAPIEEGVCDCVCLYVCVYVIVCVCMCVCVYVCVCV